MKLNKQTKAYFILQSVFKIMLLCVLIATAVYFMPEKNRAESNASFQVFSK
jgi:hypothetical protein